MTRHGTQRVVWMLSALAAGMLAALAADRAVAYPEPAIVSLDWALDFRLGQPGVISVKSPEKDDPQLFWYVTYTVTNLTSEDQLFIPDVHLLTDAGHLLQAGRNVPPAVFNEIKKHLDNPLLIHPVQIVGRILQGLDNARDGVFIWPVPDADVNEISIFIGGLSGETIEIQDPVTSEKHLLRKTLMLRYDTPGGAAQTARKPFVNRGQKWIMR